MASTGSIVGVSDAANGWFNARFCQSFGVSDGHLLTAPVAVVDQPALLTRTAGIECLLKCIRFSAGDLQGKSAERGERSRSWQTVTPSSCYQEGICVQIMQGDDAVGEGIDHEGDVNKPPPR